MIYFIVANHSLSAKFAQLDINDPYGLTEIKKTMFY
jgi:hypothetical protein